jgi:hypothetical protein
MRASGDRFFYTSLKLTPASREVLSGEYRSLPEIINQVKASRPGVCQGLKEIEKEDYHITLEIILGSSHLKQAYTQLSANKLSASERDAHIRKIKETLCPELKKLKDNSIIIKLGEIGNWGKFLGIGVELSRDDIELSKVKLVNPHISLVKGGMVSQTEASKECLSYMFHHPAFKKLRNEHKVYDKELRLEINSMEVSISSDMFITLDDNTCRNYYLHDEL